MTTAPDPHLSEFAFTMCQPGAERWLKAELHTTRPDLKPAFQRPGLVTFKATKDPFRSSERPESIFGRVWGCSAGPMHEASEIAGLARTLKAKALWVAARDAGVPGDVPPALQAAADEHERGLREACHRAWGQASKDPAPGDVVLDVVAWPGEPALVGWHRHGQGRHSTPGGRYALERPANAPSRAWHKLEEAIRWFGLDLRPGEVVLEIGAAPGGATRALLDRGLRVVAVDPQPMDPGLVGHPELRWERKTVAQLQPVEGAAWLVCDANIPPADVVPAMARLAQGSALRGIVVTLKLGSDSAARTLRARVAALGTIVDGEARAAQLPSHRHEVVAVALRR